MSKEKNSEEFELQYIKGVGPKRAEAFYAEGIYTAKDLINFFPRSYIDRDRAASIRALVAKLLRYETFDFSAQTEAISYQNQDTIIARIEDKKKRELGKNRSFLNVIVSDSSGASASIVFWNYVQYYEKIYQIGDWLVISGTPEIDKYGKLVFHHPEIIPIDEAEQRAYSDGVILPKYSIPQAFSKVGINSKSLREIIKRAIDSEIDNIRETLPIEIIAKKRFLPLKDTILNLHFPESKDNLNKSMERMKFEEMFYFQLEIALRRGGFNKKNVGLKLDSKSPRARALLDSLPFDLTRAQKRVIRELAADMSQGKAMNRLLQGDVGSGKTIVALLIALMAADNGLQTAIMAPTEILAEQHYLNFSKMLENTNIKVSQVVGGQRVKQRREIAEAVSTGASTIVTGTHALFESDIEFKNLGLVIIDEQHRFGVEQRSELIEKARKSMNGFYPHVLVMSATPIPRTLSMTLYGDLDVSIIDELPKNRKPIITKIVLDNKKLEVFDFIREEIKKGRQAYIVYPLVEKSEKMNYKSAVEHFEALQTEVFPELKLGLLHGKLFWYEKEEAMQKFLNREYDILIATTVVEVGVDVPNATIMLIEDAERFGLSQLHQLRGRVGRGSEQSYCFLATNDRIGYQLKRKGDNIDFNAGVIRLKTMEETTDGFKIAEVDLKLRGPGDAMGARQTGLPRFNFIDLIKDVEIIEETKKLSSEIVSEDNRLQMPKNSVLKAEILRKYSNRKDYLSIA